MSTIRVMVVDDHDLFRRGLIDVLSEEPDIQVIGEARNGKEAVQRAGELKPDVVFMDLNMPEQTGIEATAYITQTWPDIKVLILTVSEEPSDLFKVLGLGALGYVLKTASPREIIEALKQVFQGWVVISPSMAPRVMADLGTEGAELPSGKRSGAVGEAGTTELTRREEEILRLVADGMSNMEIANKLYLSENTVKTHIKNILGKLHVKNRGQAAAYAARVGLLQAE